MTEKRKTAVIAIGGNSLIKDKDHRSVADQYDNIVETCSHIVKLIERGIDVIITHGNGPQVGFILLRSSLAKHELHEVPVDSAGADTQGAIGYQIQQAMANLLAKKGIEKQAVTVVTQVLVDREDKAFTTPTKPIGPFLSKEEAEKNRDLFGWDIVEDAGRGYRRVVASPLPVEILEEKAIKLLNKEGFVVVAVGGGGIPVIRQDNGDLKGVAAVIDKDNATSLLASNLDADYLVISTSIDRVYINFGTDKEEGLSQLTVAEAKRYAAEGHFKPGSMLPKVEAAIDFLEKGGSEVIITTPALLDDAINGKAGTRMIMG